MKVYSKEKIIEEFREWLAVQNYDASSLRNNPRHIAELLDFTEDKRTDNDFLSISITLTPFFEYLDKRPNRQTGAAITTATKRTYLTSIKRFIRFMRLTYQVHLSHEIDQITLEKPEQYIPTVFTPHEINKLYDAADDSLIGIRDRAMLGIYYGCGLRKTEGIRLEVSDIKSPQNLVHVRKGKGYKERFVPVAPGVMTDLQNYLTYARPMLGDLITTPHFFITLTGKAVSKNTLSDRLDKLLDRANINKRAGLHSLRHSIATHLLQSGMSLEQISRFLGHGSLESTQIYTQITPNKK